MLDPINETFLSNLPPLILLNVAAGLMGFFVVRLCLDALGTVA